MYDTASADAEINTPKIRTYRRLGAHIQEALFFEEVTGLAQ